MLLPLLGGTPAVWNTCVLFFQVTLLAGYGYAHLVTRRLKFKAQATLHVALLIAAFASLPVGLAERMTARVPAQNDPIWWLLATLLLSVGLPFFALSATAPLLQKWFSKTRHATAADPYYLYAASNAGSLVALVAFPLLLEPTLRLAGQARLWTFFYVSLVALTCASALIVYRSTFNNSKEGEIARAVEENAEPDDQDLTIGRRLRWAFLAFVPSSLVLGATTYMTTDVAAVPLLWVVPFALYLLTFIIAFARGMNATKRWADKLLPGAAIVLTLVYLSGATEPAWFLILIHLVFLFVAALACHRRLADDRPTTQHLGEYYLWIAVGGAVGGLFNALLAPLLFNAIVEYPLAVVLACLARASFRVDNKNNDASEEKTEETTRAADDLEADDKRRARTLDVALPIALGATVALLSAIVMRLQLASIERLAIAIGVPLIFINHFFTKRPVRFALGLGAIMLGSFFFTENGAQVLLAERNFFGTVRVSHDPSNATLRLHHGSTIHGRQFTDQARRCEPLSYYHRQGPLGSLFEALDERPPASPNIAAVGLGTGAVAAYSKPEQAWTFYEINPLVVRLSRDEGYFTYLKNCAGATHSIVLGDARLRLRDAPGGHYAVIILDAFSSDAVPAHLLTREALDLYLSKLAEGGLVAFHVSNRALDLHSVVGGITHDAGLYSVVFDDLSFDREAGREPSQWVVVARRAEDLTALRTDERWQTLKPRRLESWRDDFSNVVTVFKWID